MAETHNEENVPQQDLPLSDKSKPESEAETDPLLVGNVDELKTDPSETVQKSQSPNTSILLTSATSDWTTAAKIDSPETGKNSALLALPGVCQGSAQFQLSPVSNASSADAPKVSVQNDPTSVHTGVHHSTRKRGPPQRSSVKGQLSLNSAKASTPRPQPHSKGQMLLQGFVSRNFPVRDRPVMQWIPTGTEDDLSLKDSSDEGEDTYTATRASVPRISCHRTQEYTGPKRRSETEDPAISEKEQLLRNTISAPRPTTIATIQASNYGQATPTNNDDTDDASCIDSVPPESGKITDENQSIHANDKCEK